MTPSRLIAALASAAALLLATAFALAALPGALGAAATLGLALLAAMALGQRRMAAPFDGPEADRRSAPQLLRIAAAIAAQAGVPAPRLYIVESAAISACALADGTAARIAVSRALLQRLRPEELAAVLAHELAHVRARDSRRLGISALLLGAGSLAVAPLLLALAAPEYGFLPALALLLPLFLGAAWAQMALCRAREFRADAVAAALCGHPHWIAVALDRVRDGDDGRAGFSSHPPVRERITRLHVMAGPWL
ncbi:MAG: hypothetical protein FJX19_09700 [Alphaproteobacteria bacterium]|nr:hypothetical protein [Alphaproteobacteria bacterium]